MTYVLIAIGGAFGALARFTVDNSVTSLTGGTFPWGTLTINIVGSFVIGFIGAVASPEGRMNSQSRVFATQFLMVGVCGGYTTFSSFSLQTLNLLRDREWLYAGGNVIFSVTLCLVAVWLGWLAGSIFSSAK